MKRQMGLDQQEFRLVMGNFASGVVIVTTEVKGICYGTTVSSFCSLSLNPPLVLVCLAHTSTSHDLIGQKGVFGINFLGRESQDLSTHFASRGENKFASVLHRQGQHGVPLLDEAMATLECRLVEQYPGGDHTIFVGEVLGGEADSSRQPLLYFRSSYHGLEQQHPWFCQESAK